MRAEDWLDKPIRPLVTLMLVGAVVVLVIMGVTSASVLETMAAMALAWWFKDRSDTKERDQLLRAAQGAPNTEAK